MEDNFFTTIYRSIAFSKTEFLFTRLAQLYSTVGNEQVVRIEMRGGGLSLTTYLLCPLSRNVEVPLIIHNFCSILLEGSTGGSGKFHKFDMLVVTFLRIKVDLRKNL